MRTPEPARSADSRSGASRLRQCALAVMGLVVLAGVALKSTESSARFQLFGSLVSEIETSEEQVAITFDDGPNPPFTGRILDQLKAYGARATFFVLGHNAEMAPQDLPRIIREGHELGNHGYWHSAMTFKRARVIEAEVLRTDRLLAQAGAKQPIHIRAPYGRKLLVAPWVFSRLGKIHVMWSVEPDPSEFAPATAQSIAASVLARIRRGSIVLLHDGGGDRSATVEALGIILPGLARRGLKSVTVSELLRAGGRGSTGRRRLNEAEG